jgi:hypothetical protein
LRRRGEPDVVDAAEFAYLTLARRGNVFGATWAWFTLEIQGGEVAGGALRVPGAVTKNGKPLAVPLSGPLLDVIRRRWGVRVAACPHVFHRGGRPIVSFDGTWRAAAAAVGLPGVLFHDLRRSEARNLRRAGVAEDVIMRLGGWRTRSMFSRYSIVDERDLADAGQSLCPVPRAGDDRAPQGRAAPGAGMTMAGRRERSRTRSGTRSGTRGPIARHHPALSRWNHKCRERDSNPHDLSVNEF